MEIMLQMNEDRELANCRCVVITIEQQANQEIMRELTQQMEEKLDQFPHPRNNPAEAVAALHHVRQLRDRIIACHKKQAGHVQNRDAP